MTIAELISSEIPALSAINSANDALHYMEDFHLPMLPLVIDDVFQGMITEGQLLDLSDTSVLVKNLATNYPSCAINNSEYVLKALSVAQENNSTLVAVLNEDQKYIGCIAVLDIAKYLGREYFMIHEGGTIVLSLQERDYSLAEIARLIEGNNARILHSFVSYDPNNALNVRVTLKINIVEVGRVIATLERYNYTVVERFGFSSVPDIDQERLGSLMRYLNI